MRRIGRLAGAERGEDLYALPSRQLKGKKSMRMPLLAAITSSAMVLAADESREIHSFAGIDVATLLKAEIDQGCGCSFYLPSDTKAAQSPIVQWDIDGPASMHLQGRLERLKIVQPLPLHAALGQGASCELENASTKVRGSFKATWVCPEGSESCEVTRYAGTLSVIQGSVSTPIPVQGDCGC